MAEYDRATIAPAIIAQIATGKSLREICRAEEMPAASTFLLWVSEDAALAEQYARAMQSRADLIFDEILEITDDARNDWMERHGQDDAGYVANGEHIQRARLRVDARKWMLGKMNPKKYGEKLELSGDPDRPLAVSAVQYTVIDPKGG